MPSSSIAPDTLIKFVVGLSPNPYSLNSFQLLRDLNTKNTSHIVKDIARVVFGLLTQRGRWRCVLFEIECYKE